MEPDHQGCRRLRGLIVSAVIQAAAPLRAAAAFSLAAG
ncbi:hypothetical protein VARIO8X_20305 [Burkholderiales bacterium 8X]|nr:hypothetical protein VARIO8X_20305 [Burkholderiales bacterium 8X]